LDWLWIVFLLGLFACLFIVTNSINKWRKCNLVKYHKQIVIRTAIVSFIGVTFWSIPNSILRNDYQKDLRKTYSEQDKFEGMTDIEKAAFDSLEKNIAAISISEK